MAANVVRRDFRSEVRSALESRGGAAAHPRLTRFEERLSAAEHHDVYADDFESQGRMGAARAEARLAGEFYRDAAYAIIPPTALEPADLVLGDAAVRLMDAAGRAYQRGRSMKKAQRAYDLAERWASFNERARLRF